MRLRQLAGVAERVARQSLVPRLPVDFNARYEAQIPETVRPDVRTVATNLRRLRSSLTDSERSRFQVEAARTERGVLRFMNTPMDIATGTELDWDDERLEHLPILWRLKLEGFEFLPFAYLGYASPDVCPDDVTAAMNGWILDWAAKTTIGTEDYLRRKWTPHSVSLRIVNLCRYLAWWGEAIDGDTAARFARIVYKNALFLDNHVEYDVGGNHLIENAAGLTLAGATLPSGCEDWLQRGLSILAETTDQFLSDGGHFERSPMYHIQCLARYLTALDTANERGIAVPAEIEETTRRATAYLRALRPPDGRIPLLNDSLFDYTLSLGACLSYAEAVGISERGVGDTTVSGYYWLGDGADRMLLDGGRAGPPHLPGHAHNDVFSFLLWLDGNRLVTDTGAFEYAYTTRRHYSRSVEAHNGVQVGNSEPIDIGGQYLMGRRFSPTVRTYAGNGVSVFDGTYRKQTLLGTSYRHRRKVYHRGTWWLVWDAVSADEECVVRSRVRFHPDCTVSREEDRFAVRHEPTATTLRVCPFSTTGADVERCPYYPKFGVERDRAGVTFRSRGAETSCGYLLTDAEVETAELETAAGQATTLRLDGRRYSLPRPGEAGRTCQ